MKISFQFSVPGEKRNENRKLKTDFPIGEVVTVYMRKQQKKSEILFATLFLVIACGSISNAQGTRPDIRRDTHPLRAHSQRARDRKSVPDYQHDPVRLIKEFYLDEKTNRSVFDLSLSVENSLGSGQWSRLDEKRRAAVTKAFENAVNDIIDEWTPETAGQVRVLKSEIEDNRATVTVLRELDLIRFSLASRDGIWFITEHEVVDDALPELADSIRGALEPGTMRGLVYNMPSGDAIKYVDDLIAKQGESPQLLLLKYRVLASKQFEEEEVRSAATLKLFQSGKAEASETRLQQPMPLQDDRALEQLQSITQRWPDFAPAHLALAFDLLYYGNDDAVLSSISKDAERAITPLRHYIELVPYDPRPWRDLAHAYALLEKNIESEEAFRNAIKLDPTYLDHRAVLVSFLLSCDELEKAKVDFKRMLEVAAKPDEAFDGLYEEGGFDPDYAKMIENLLLSFPKELDASKSGLVLLSIAQESQNKPADAVRTMQRAITISAGADDYEYLSQLYRQQRRFTEALNAANQALKLDGGYAGAYFERACSLAQLGRKRDALAALKQMMNTNSETVFDLDEPDLQPLANLPEFKILKEKLKQAAEPVRAKKPER